MKAIAVFVCCTVLCSSAAEAQSKAFKISGEGVAPEGLPIPGQPARPHGIVGQATHLGRHMGMGSVKTVTALPGDGVITGTFCSGSAFEFMAANGDVLACDYGQEDGETTGTYEIRILDVQLVEGEPVFLVEADFVAEFVPTDASTGRFEGVTGGWTMFAFTEPFILGSSLPIDYRWEGRGRLTFKKNKNK